MCSAKKQAKVGHHVRGESYQPQSWGAVIIASSVTLSWSLSDARRLSAPHPNRNPNFNILILSSLVGDGEAGTEGRGREKRKGESSDGGLGGGRAEEDM